MTLSPAPTLKLSRRQAALIAVIVAVLVGLTLLLAPSGDRIRSGSTYSRFPDGYGAWAAFMAQRGTPVQRWQKPLKDFWQRSPTDRPETLVRVYPDLSGASLAGVDLGNSAKVWVDAGNTLVLLGVWTPVTAAPFSSDLESETGTVRLETGRRLSQLEAGDETLLRDDFGAAVWREPLGRGQIVYVVTPHLAANAYQAAAGNFPFLAQLVSADDRPVWVDEYLHGYRDPDVLVEEGSRDPLSYLAKTPLLPVAAQMGVLLLVILWGQNRRLGAPLALIPPAKDNSGAYIEALAQVLHKANSSEFVLDLVGKEEQLRLQRALGLGTDPLDLPTLAAAWAEQTGRPAAEIEHEIEQVFRPCQPPRRLSEPQLQAWLDRVAQLRANLPS